MYLPSVFRRANSVDPDRMLHLIRVYSVCESSGKFLDTSIGCKMLLKFSEQLELSENLTVAHFNTI